MGERDNSRLEETVQSKSWNKIIGMKREYDLMLDKSTRKARDLHDAFLSLYNKHLQKYGETIGSGKGPLEIPKSTEILSWSNKEIKLITI